MTASVLGAHWAPDQQRWLHRYAVGLAVAAFLLLIAGGLVTSTGSGYASPEPIKMDRFEGTGLYEHSHRSLAWIVGALVVGAVVLFGVWERRIWVRRLAIGALAAVVLQGALGMLTVRFQLPPQISIAHAALAQIMFSLLVSLAVVTSPWWINSQRAVDVADVKESRRAWATVLVVYLQILLGAWYRHTSSTVALTAHLGGVLAVAMHVFLMKHHRMLLAVFLLQLVMGPIAWIFSKGKVVKAIGEQPEPLARALPITVHVALGAVMLAVAVVVAVKSMREEPRTAVTP